MLPLSLMIQAASAGAPPVWRAASAVTNAMPYTTTASTGTQLRRTSRSKIIIGADCTELKFMVPNKFVAAAAITSNTNAVTINKMALEKVTGGAAYVAATFSGSASATNSAGNAWLTSDAITASAFGLSKFSRGEEYWLRMDEGVTTATHKFISLRETGSVSSSAATTSNFSVLYDPGTATISDVYGTGGITNTGTGRTTCEMACVVTLGKMSASQSVFVGVGDSIVEHLSDSVSHTMGLFGRSLFDAGLSANPRPGINLGRGSSASSLWQASGAAFLTDMLQYGNVLVDDYGTNGPGTAPTYPENNAIWAAARALNYKRVIRLALLPRATSSDTFITEANQTVDAGFGGGASLTLFQSYLSTNSALFDALLPLTSIRAGSNTNKWVVNGVANYATSDGIHPEDATCELVAVDLRAIYSSLGL